MRGREVVVFQNVLGQGIHRLPWVLPSQELDHMHRIAEAMTRARVGTSAWPTAGAINLLASRLSREASTSGTPDDVSMRREEPGVAPPSREVDGAEGVDVHVHQLANTIRRLSQQQRDSLISML